MLPYLKNKFDASPSMTVETKEREHDEDFDMLEAVAGDMLQAFEKKDMKLLRSALEALCEHIQDLDQTQDMEMKS